MLRYDLHTQSVGGSNLEDTRQKTDYEYIKDVYESLLDEKKVAENIKEKFQNSIKEIDLYLKSIFEKEDVDYEVFSPRNVGSIYKEKIDKKNMEKQKLIDKNIEINQKIQNLQTKIDLLSKVMLNMKHSDKKFDEKNFDISYVMLDIQEKERQRIARDLHDNIVQNLTHMIHKIELSSKFIDQDPIRAKMELMDINRNMKSIINDMRDVIFNLRPMEFDDMGLKTTFEKYFTDMKFKSGIDIEYHIENVTLHNQLSDISLYHIVKECVNNSIKHSKAAAIHIKIVNEDNNIKIIIDDDGIGFDDKKVTDNRHFGISLLKESVSILGGTIDIHSIIDKGTTISICIPCVMEKGEGSFK